MNRNHAILLFIAILTFPLISLFIPDDQAGNVSSLDGVELVNVTGQKFKFSGIFTDKPTMLVFWSVTCASCIEEIPFVSRMHDEYKDRLTVIGIHPPGYPAARIQKFIRRYKPPIPYLVAIDESSSLIQKYQVTVLPRTIIINRQGKVLYDHLGYEPGHEKDMENAILAKL
jgi:thiol-disulfide isomerase/thioredoxin